MQRTIEFCHAARLEKYSECRCTACMLCTEWSALEHTGSAGSWSRRRLAAAAQMCTSLSAAPAHKAYMSSCTFTTFMDFCPAGFLVCLIPMYTHQGFQMSWETAYLKSITAPAGKCNQSSEYAACMGYLPYTYSRLCVGRSSHTL